MIVMRELLNVYSEGGARPTPLIAFGPRDQRKPCASF
jgi:hypothetical protein